MRVEVLAFTEKATLVVERLPDGKIRTTSLSFDGDKVIMTDQVLEVRNIGGRIRIARKERLPDEGDLPKQAAADDPYGENIDEFTGV
jgi:hypothetical protein